MEGTLPFKSKLFIRIFAQPEVVMLFLITLINVSGLPKLTKMLAGVGPFFKWTVPLFTIIMLSSDWFDALLFY